LVSTDSSSGSANTSTPPSSSERTVTPRLAADLTIFDACSEQTPLEAPGVDLAPQFHHSHSPPAPPAADPAITTSLIGLPNHPSFPSGHSCQSSAATTVLTHFIPKQAEDLQRQLELAGLSRMYAGIHYRFDRRRSGARHIGREIRHPFRP
jgi:membrane-associated phospholipid phosphatase